MCIRDRAVFGREGELEAARRLSGEPSLGFSGDMRRMVVEDQLDRRTGRVSGIEKLEKFDELTAAVTLLDQGMDLPGEQINSGQEAERAMALVLIIARECRVGARHRRQIRCCRSNRLDPGFSSWETIVTGLPGFFAFFFALAAAFFRTWTSR